MNLHLPAGKNLPYPKVVNHIEDDPTPKDQAIYVPSVSPDYAITAYEQNWSRPLPQGVDPEDMNFLDPANKLFRISHVMSSAGQALYQSKPCIIQKRDRRKTLMVGDSGGYQIASGRLQIHGDADRLRILRWLEEHADVAMTLDVPTGPVRSGGYKFKTVNDCLTTTLDHLSFFSRNRKNENIRFLNVLQGNDQGQADVWYDAVKQYEFEGWAFAGILRHNFQSICRRILIMADEGQIQNKKWIHVLGTNELETAVMLTALQRSINRHINPDLRISFDTSSPFRNLAWGNTYSLPKFDSDRMTFPTAKIPNSDKLLGSSIKWPWPSAIGNKMSLGDICYVKNTKTGSTWDRLSTHLICLHNLSALCDAVALANRVFDSETYDQHHSIATLCGKAVNVIDDVLRTGSMAELSRNSHILSALRHGEQPKAEDDARAFLDDQV